MVVWLAVSSYACDFTGLSSNDGSTRIVALSAEGISTKELEQWASLIVPKGEIELQKKGSSERYFQFLLGRAALAKALEGRGGKLIRMPEGYLIWADSSGSTLFVNISHTKGMAVAALAEKPVGIDIELQDRAVGKALMRVANPEEIQNAEKAHGSRGRIYLWSAKEALGKSIGMGLGANLRETPLDWNTENGVRTSAKSLSGPMRLEKPSVVQIFHGNYVISIAGERESLETVIRSRSLDRIAP